MEQQIYSSNSTRPYPLSEDKHVLPDDLLVDMSLTVNGPAVVPVITAVTTSPGIFFMSIEDSVSKESIAHVSVRNPSPFSFYAMTDYKGEYAGWVVTGPAVTGRNTYPEIQETLDDSVILYNPVSTYGIEDVKLNGDLPVNVSGELDIRTASPSLYIREEVRDIEGVGDRLCIVIGRNSDDMSLEQLYYSFTDITPPTIGYIRKIAGALPDANGNVDITTGPASFTVVPIKATQAGGTDEDVGLLFNQSDEVCFPEDQRNKILHGRCEQGATVDLPLDYVSEEIHPEYTQEDCGCGG